MWLKELIFYGGLMGFSIALIPLMPLMPFVSLLKV